MSSGDIRAVKYASAGMILSGLLVTIGLGVLLPLKGSIKDVTSKNYISWSPGGLMGSQGRSPLFGFMWSFIYIGELIYALVIVLSEFLEMTDKTDATDVFTLFNHSACVYAALLLSSVWPSLFVQQKKWSFVLAAFVLVLTACILLIGAVISQPFSNNMWWNDIGAIVTSFFAGWVCVAAALNVGIVTRVYNRGVNANDTEEQQMSIFPLVLSIVLGIVCIFSFNPILPVPLFLSTFFIKGIFTDWRTWSATITCAVSITIASCLVFNNV